MAEFPEEPIYGQLARVGKALGSPVRLRLLDLLEPGERTVEELAAACGVGVKNTSAQLQQLRSARLVESRKDGTRVRYRLADAEVPAFLQRLQSFAEHRLADLREAIAERLGDPAEMRPITAEELASRLHDGTTVVIDVRSAAEHAAGHVPGAVSVPHAELSAALDWLPGDVEVVAYCQGPYCVLSPDAVRLLRSAGIDARPLDGGYTRWSRSTSLHTGPSEPDAG